MPQFTIKLPVASAPANFARRVRTKAGLGALYTRSNVSLPGPNVFAGLAAFFGKNPNPLPGPNVFGSFANRSGLRAFFATVPPQSLPGGNIFVPFIGGAQNRPQRCAPAKSSSCGTCRKRRNCRGMGDDVTANLSDLPQATLIDVPSDLGSTLVNQVSPVSPASSPAFTLAPSTNASLDQFNQSLTNSVANPTTVGANLSASQLAQLSNLVGSASPAAVATTAQQLGTSTLSSTVTGILTNYGGYLLLAGAGIFAISVIGSSKKGKR
jgi:hypothetical protein